MAVGEKFGGFLRAELSSNGVGRSFRQISHLRRLRSRGSQTLWFYTGAWFGKESFPMALTRSSRSSTAQCLRQQNAKGRTRLTLTTSRLRAGSANTSAKQRLKRRPDRASLRWEKWLQRQQAGSRRLSRVAFNEPCTTHRRPGKRLKRQRGFVGYKL